jgi:hypothetical protein
VKALLRPVGLILGAFLLGAVGGHLEAQAPPLPGSAQDPLVTESYVSQAIAKAQLGAGQLVDLTPGEALSVNLGSQLVVVGGSLGASATPDLVDLTAGATIAPGATLLPDHLVLSLARQTVTAGTEGAMVYATGGASATGGPS